MLINPNMNLMIPIKSRSTESTTGTKASRRLASVGETGGGDATDAMINEDKPTVTPSLIATVSVEATAPPAKLNRAARD